ncbi:MAG: ATP-binding protein [Parcubacteria group bacterium]|nr:ATP-binding protein [Parcubacteria group bacterium]
MDKNEIIKILEDWNFWNKSIAIGIKRPFYLEKLQKLLTAKQIIVITGARRSGKSFIMRQLAENIIQQGVDKKNILMINLEDPRFVDLDVSLLQKIYETYLEFLQPKGKHYVLLDEVQEVEKWEKWVLMMQELKKAQIILSGSNAKLLSRELATLLTGRHLNMQVMPLSFKEFLNFNGVANRDELAVKGLLKNFIEEGAFPEVVLNKQKKELLLTYFNDILEKDLIKRYKVRKTEKFKEVLKFYFSNISSLVTSRSSAKSLEVSAETVEKFSSYFETNYLLFFLKRFSFKTREQNKSPRKVYAIDVGLSNAVGFRFSENIGKLIENVVFLRLLRKSLSNPLIEIFYWKDEKHKEVDFLLKENTVIKQLIQVCWDLSDIKTRKREIDALLKSSIELQCNDLLVITDEDEKQEEVKGKIIKFVPLWKWLLNEK